MQVTRAGGFLRPVVLITSDLDHAAQASEDVYHVRCAYARVLEQAGALPLIVAHSADLLARLGSLCDGVLFSGSAPGRLQSKARGAFEAELVSAALTQALPVLGICHGMQVLGQALGGKLADLAHAQQDHNPATGPGQLAHRVALRQGSLLEALAGTQEIGVNSMHQQVLQGDGHFAVVARAADGAVEAIEGDQPAFCMGLQWHPEYGLTETDRKIIEVFVAACAARATARTPSKETQNDHS